MEWVETTGRTKEEALELALDRLGVDETEIEYELLEAPRTGIFGRLSRPTVRLRARVRPISREKPDTRRRRDQRRSGSGDSRTGGRAGRTKTEAKSSGSDVGKEEPSGRPTGRRKPAKATTGVDAPREEQDKMETQVPLEEQVKVAGSFVEGLVREFAFAATVSARSDENDDIQIDVHGENLGFLVGPKGNTLSAIQELTRTALQRRTSGGSARVHVDVAGYRKRRTEALIGMAQQVAQSVIESGQDQAFEPMVAADRKVIHDALHEVVGVGTFSEGEEPRRRVVVTSEGLASSEY